MRTVPGSQLDTTLWELVWSVGEVLSDDRKVVAAVSVLLRSGAVRLCGAFCDCPIECFLDERPRRLRLSSLVDLREEASKEA